MIFSAAKAERVPAELLYAIGLTESGYKGGLHPYALNVHGKTFFPTTARQAMQIFRREKSGGKNLIDLGCMQINFHYHGHAFDSPGAMLDPHKNVRYAAQFLRRLKDRHGSWVTAVARYHAGDRNHAAQKKYVCKVLDHMISNGAAAHTDSTKKLCRSEN